MGFFKEIFPEAKFVHVIRDGRAVANSLLQMEWWTGYLGPNQWNLGPLQEKDRREFEAHDECFVVLAGLVWKSFIESIEADADRLHSSDLLTIQYEDFLREPVTHCERIAEFGDLVVDEDFSKRLRRTKVSASRADAFRKDLRPEQLAQLEVVIGSELRRFGYLPS